MIEKYVNDILPEFQKYTYCQTFERFFSNSVRLSRRLMFQIH